jgi:hypothetical protein
MFLSVLDVSAHKPKDTILRVVGLEGVVIYSNKKLMLSLSVCVCFASRTCRKSHGTTLYKVLFD